MIIVLNYERMVYQIFDLLFTSLLCFIQVPFARLIYDYQGFLLCQLPQKFLETIIG